MAYKEFYVDQDRALQYVVGCLAEYQDWLPCVTHLIRSCTDTKWLSKTFWDSDYNYSATDCFHGYLSNRELTKLAHDWAFREIDNYLQDESNVFVSLELTMTFDEAVSVYRDSLVSVEKTDCILFWGDKDVGAKSIYEMIGCGSDGHFSIGWITKKIPNLVDGNISTHQLLVLLENASCLLAGAYDDEGFILMEKKLGGRRCF